MRLVTDKSQSNICPEKIIIHTEAVQHVQYVVYIRILHPRFSFLKGRIQPYGVRQVLHFLSFQARIDERNWYKDVWTVLYISESEGASSIKRQATSKAVEERENNRGEKDGLYIHSCWTYNTATVYYETSLQCQRKSVAHCALRAVMHRIPRTVSFLVFVYGFILTFTLAYGCTCFHCISLPEWRIFTWWELTSALFRLLIIHAYATTAFIFI